MEQLSGQAAPAKPERKVTTLQIAGIPVEFPFEPYACQRDYMESVITALQQGKNALLESPTGTGKTLCLLCSTLAWRESLKPATPDPTAAAAAALAQQAGLGLSFGALQGLSGTATSAAASLIASGGSGPPGPGGGAGGGGAPKADLPLIIYSSRTHSQLAQVMKELRNSSYKDRVRSTVLSSRQQTCLHPTVSKLSGGAANQACKAMTAARKCSWHNQIKFGKYRNAASSLVSPVPDIEELVATGKAHGVCPFYLGRDAGKEADIVFLPYNYLLDPSTRRTMAENINWSNAVVIFDEAHNVESVSSDSCSFDITAKQLTDAMLETKRCKEACLERIERGAVALVDVAAPGETDGLDYRRMAADMDLLQGVLKLLENGLHALAAKLPPPHPGGHGGDGGGLTRPGSFLFEFLGQLGITAHSLSALNAAIDAAADILAAADVEAGRTNAKTSTVALQHLQSCLNLAFSTLEPLSDKPGAPPAHKGFRTHIHLQRSWGADKLPAPTLSYWCFIPGMAFRRLAALRLRSFLLTSGTLSPLDSFAAELQIPFHVRLENPHVIAPSQVWVGVLPTGPSGVALNSTFASRDSTAYKDELGNALVNVARLVPDGLLVFFASYAAMDSAINHWKQNGGSGGVGSTWERIIRHKAPVVEPRESSAFGAAIEEFRAKLDDPATQGAVFFAVCRGKVSEGLDFSDRAGRAVVITGIPYAVKNDPKVRLKRDVLDEEARAMSSGGSGLAGEGVAPLTGEAWYTNSAMRAVNQAMGRVIRHRWDYGAILLADDRFRTPATQRNMSRWVREHVTVYEHFGKASASLTKFFKDKASFQAPSKALPGRSTHMTAFETVGAGAGPGAAGPAGGAGLGGGGRGGQSLLESVPAAIDVSGIGALAATGLGGGRTAKAAAGPVAVAATGGGKKPTGGLLGLLRSAPAAADAVQEPAVALAAAAAAPAAAGAAASGGASGSTGSGAAAGGGGAIGLSAALECVGNGRGGSGPGGAAAAAGKPPSGTQGGGGGGGLTALPSRPFPGALGPGVGRGGGGGMPPRAAPLSMLALAGGVVAAPAPAALAPLGPCGAGGGGVGGCAAVEVVAPPHKLAELRRRAAAPSNGGGGSQPSSPDRQLDPGGANADLDPDPVADLMREDGTSAGATAGPRTSGGLTRIVLQPVQPTAGAGGGVAAAGPRETKPAAGSGGGDVGAGADGTQSEAPEAGVGVSPAAAGGAEGPADGGGGGGGAAGAVKADPKAFLAQLKSELPPEAFKEFQRLITKYKSGKDLSAFVDGVVVLLRGPATCHLLRGVAAFMPRDQRDWFSNVIAVHMRAAAPTNTNTTTAPGQPGPASAPPGPDRGRPAPAAAAPAAAPKGALGKRPAPPDSAAAASAAVAAQAAGRPPPGRQPGSSRVGGTGSDPGPQSQQPHPHPSASQVRAASAAAMSSALAASSSSGSQLRTQLLSRQSSQAQGHGHGQGQGQGQAAGRAEQHPQQPQGQKQHPPGYVGAYGSADPAPPPAKRPNLGAGPSSSTAKATAAAVNQRPASAAGSAAGGSRGGGGGGGAAAATAAAVGGGGGVLSSAAAAVSCSLCGKRPMANAHEGPCGHLACYNCWLVQLAVHFKCKTCGRAMRQKNLTKKYFM